PPTINRVITCVMRIRPGSARSRFQQFRLEFEQAVGDLFEFFRYERGAAKIKLVIFYCSVGLFITVRDFPQPVITLISGGGSLLKGFIILLGGLKLVAAQIADGAVEPGLGIGGLQFQRMIQGWNRPIESAHLQTSITFVD